MAKVMLSICLVAMMNVVLSIQYSMFDSCEICIVEFLNSSIGSGWETILPCNIIRLVEDTIMYGIERLY